MPPPTIAPASSIPGQDESVYSAARGRDRGGCDPETVARAAIDDLDGAWTAADTAEPGPVDVIDLFSGCGGMSAGFKLVNAYLPAYRLAAAVDLDPVANDTYELNLGCAPETIDIGELATDPQQVRSLGRGLRRGHPWVLIGCAPCQGFSSHRNSAGAQDARNSLFSHVVTIAEELMPDVVIAENVPELVTDRYWPLVADARQRLAEVGYSVNVAVHNTAEHGVPQERFRVVILAMRTAFAPLPSRLSRKDFRTVRDAIGTLPRIAAGERIGSDPWHYTASHRSSTLEILRAVPHDGGNRPMDVGPDCLRRANAKNGKPAYEDVYGRLAWDRPSVTITNFARNPASGRYVHPDQDRGLSIREAACLQGFPRAFRFVGSLDPCFRQIGNAVPPMFAASLAAHVYGELRSPAAAAETPGIEKSIGPSFSRLIPALKAETRSLDML